MKIQMTKITIIGAFVLACASFAAAQNKSVYTSLETKNCKTIESSVEESGWYRGRCKGVGGYKLEITEGDLRQTNNVVAPSGKIFELGFGQVSSAFSYVGAKAEWRMKGKIPVALIVRFIANSDAEDYKKNTSHLVVSKISKSGACITDVVAPGKTQNAEAQKLADAAAKKPCMQFE